MTACPPPAKDWPLFERWCEHGRLPKERPAGLRKQVPTAWFDCYRHLHPKPAPKPVHSLGVYERVAFFVNPDNPAGEILAGAWSAKVTLATFNYGDNGDWSGWLGHTIAFPFSRWARCDTQARCNSLVVGKRNVANIESPEITSGFCPPRAAVMVVEETGAVITECEVPHADWRPVAAAGMPVGIEIDPNVAIVRDKGIRTLVEYGRNVIGSPLVVPTFFITQNAWWDGRAETFETYWDQLREQHDGPFWLYAAENVPDWSVIR